MNIYRALPLLLALLSTGLLGQTTAPAPQPSSADELKSKFETQYLDVLRRSFGSIGNENVAQFWERAHQIVFGQRQNDDASAQQALDLFSASENCPRIAYEPIDDEHPLYLSGPEGKRMEQELQTALAALRENPHPTEADRQNVREKLAPFLRTLQADLASRTGCIEVPANTALVYEAKPYCLQHNLPAPATGDPMWLVPASMLIPKAAVPIYEALLAYSERNEADRGIIQTLLWAIRESNEHPLTELSAEQKRVLDAALPEGSGKFLAFMTGKPVEDTATAVKPRRPRPPVDDIYGPSGTGSGATDSDPYAVPAQTRAGAGTNAPKTRTIDDSKRTIAEKNRQNAGIVEHGLDWRDPAQVQRILDILSRAQTQQQSASAKNNSPKPTDAYTLIGPKIAIRTIAIGSLSRERIEILNVSSQSVQIDLSCYVALTRRNCQPFAITTVTRKLHYKLTVETVTIARRIVEQTNMVLLTLTEARATGSSPR